LAHVYVQVYTGGIENVIKVWDLRKMEVAMQLKGHSDTVTGLRVSPDGTHLLSNAMVLLPPVPLMLVACRLLPCWLLPALVMGSCPCAGYPCRQKRQQGRALQSKSILPHYSSRRQASFQKCLMLT
jgi:hypothetical protein